MTVLPRHINTIATASDIGPAFESAQAKLHLLLEKPEFQDACQSADVDPVANKGTYPFWKQFADFTVGMVTRAGEAGISSTEIDALGLLAVAPAFLHASRAYRLQQRDKQDARRAVAFHRSLKSFALNHTATPVSTIDRSLNTVSRAIPMPNTLRSAAPHIFRCALKGAQHELGLGQAIKGLDWEEATIDEDIKGFDYKVWGKGRYPLLIDAKSSVADIRKYGEYERDYVRRPDGVIVMYSGFSEEDFGDSFFVSDELAAARGREIAAMLAREENWLTAG